MVGIANDFLSEFWGWILAVVVVVAYAALQLRTALGTPGRRPVRRSRSSLIVLQTSASRS